jgi:hypothetical protein
VLLGALASFAIVVLGVLLWASLSGNAGSQRGLVIHSELSYDVVVSVAGSAPQTIEPAHERTFVVKRAEFPASIVYGDARGDALTEQFFEYAELVEADFRLSIDLNGIYRTTDYRDTPVATP